LTLDRGGNLYGTTPVNSGGSGAGSVFKMTHRNGGWTLAPVFNSGSYGDVTIGPNGSLYLTGVYGQGTHGAGSVFNLKPPVHFLPNLLAPWTATVLHVFEGDSDGAGPYGGVVFDQAGNIYGTTTAGPGSRGFGAVYELSPSGGGGYTENVIYVFSGTDGQMPLSKLAIDAAGNLYGTTVLGGAFGNGTVFKLSYSAGSGWTETFLYSFTGGADGANPYGGLILDATGNLYGATPGPFSSGVAGTIFKLTSSGDSLTLSTIFSLGNGGNECGPRGTPVMDAAGNLYDTTTCLGSHGGGTVFKLTHINGGWTSTLLHDFGSGNDGIFPQAGVTVDANGNLYGTTSAGGANGNGIVFEITP
jgi:uncharacterized repeat protein (TIGR03803 family)